MEIFLQLMFTTIKDATLRFTYTYQPTLEDANMKHTENQLIDCFFRKIALNILKDKEAYLQTGLLQDIKKRVSNVDCRNQRED